MLHPKAPAVVALIAALLTGMAAAAETAPFVGKDFQRKEIYHSPQKPGWTSWVGAWLMPDDSMMVSFVQATGELQEKHKKRDYGGLQIDVIYLRSTDGGKHWEKTAVSPVNFATPRDSGKGTHANNGGPTIALKDGSILRRVYAFDYDVFPKMPGTSFLQRSSDYGKTWSAMPTSDDGGKTWSDVDPKLQEFLLDPTKYTVQPTRAHRLRDGRLLISGGVWNGQNTQKAPYEPLLMVSEDEAASWKRVDFIRKPGYDASWNKQFNEWDTAELASGDLLVVSRAGDNKSRWVGVLEKAGNTWAMTRFAKTDALPHSGHPDLLATREGPVLHLATTGIMATSDAGQTWWPVEFPDAAKNLRAKEEPSTVSTRYYPRSIQTSAGRIFVFSHRGADDYYGRTDQSVLMDSFQLAKP
jgi:photosystem II stability/assembly factor-like uncharacterized protein